LLWAKQRVAKGKKVYALPEEWNFEHQHWAIKLAVQQYRANGKRYIPHLEEIMEQVPSWVSDVLFADEVLEFFANDDPMVTAFEKARNAGNIGITASIPQTSPKTGGNPD